MLLGGESVVCTLDLFSGLCSLIDSREIWWNAIIPYLTNLWRALNILITHSLIFMFSSSFRIIISLVFQIVLILYGNRRKHVANAYLQNIVWVAYLGAEGIAISALSLLSTNSKESSSDPSFIIEMSWAPFLLLHLGGPDTISALALEDNELWQRHLIQLPLQLLTAGLVVKSSWNGSYLNYITILIFIVGMIKYGERILAQRLGSRENLRKSILPPADPGPNYAKFMDEYTARKAEGYNVCVRDVIDTNPIISHHSQGAIANASIEDASAIHDGYVFFQNFRCLFADLSLSFQDRARSREFFNGLALAEKWEHAFKVVEVELELMYERLYTKAVLTNSMSGIVIKTVSFFCTFSAFITFCLLDKGPVDIDKIIITILLFIAAIFFEMYGFIVLLCSNWIMWRLSGIKNWKVDLLYWLISWYQKLFNLSHTKRWTNEMKQFNFISFCLKDESCIQKLPLINKFFTKSYYQPPKSVPEELKIRIFDQLKQKSKDASGMKACKKLCALRGDGFLKYGVLPKSGVHENIDKESGVLPKSGVHENIDKECYEILRWSINEVEFDQSILLWHIATDLCCCKDEGGSPNNAELQSRETSLLLSNYMLYHLVVSPSMLPTGIGQTRFEDTLFEATELLQERKYISKFVEACHMILRVNTEILPSQVKGDKNKSVLFDACRLAKSLQCLVSKENWNNEEKWKMISYVWVEMLCHAACNCRGFLHAKQLSKGGELLTHVWLLMAHFGITEQFQMSKGHTRAKLLLS